MRLTKTVITFFILILALFQGPLIYYYCNGYRGFLILYPNMIIGFSISLFLVTKIRHKQTNTPFILIGGTIGILLGLVSLFSEGAIEYLDWTLRKNERNKIVNEIKQSSANFTSVSNFPPISNNGKIHIQRFDDSTILVEFYINSGYLDHYSAFSYTNNSSEMEKLDQHISKKESGFEKVDSNWYRVSY